MVSWLLVNFPHVFCSCNLFVLYVNFKDRKLLCRAWFTEGLKKKKKKIDCIGVKPHFGSAGGELNNFALPVGIFIEL